MQISVEAQWSRVDRDALAPGDFIQGEYQGKRVYGMICEHATGRLFVHFWMEGDPEPKLSIEDEGVLGMNTMRYNGRFRITPIREKGTADAPVFPAIGVTAQHGSVVINPNSGNWLICNDETEPGRKTKVIVNLETGRLLTTFKFSDIMGGADVFASWHLSAIMPDGSESVFCRMP